MSDRPNLARNLTVTGVVLWVLQVVLAAEFLYSGYLLFSGGDTVDTFEQLGLGQWLRYLTGVLEVAGAIGLLIPRLAGLAALGLAGVMVGATATEIFVLEDGSPVLPLILLLVCAGVAWFRRASTLALLGR
ncbi:DoxX family protein [Amycolatopsis cihanbeyliensis]|uniref:DoxX-like protein n=1 Tax=Amycolatopsis cihanbeyliensis TaxID=1128664 RepID=A0A542DFD2_AMYCI|nr:DoxX family protein [Amycolatopsis cihanbeyliensis]TQJ01795.1 DoxX-like protein [Amycolatopsis cihanbeyliensis]